MSVDKTCFVAVNKEAILSIMPLVTTRLNE